MIQSTNVVRHLGAPLDSVLTMKKHVNKVTSTRFFRQIRRLVGQDLAAQLLLAFVPSRLDYGNSSLVGLPVATIAPPQRVQNAAACSPRNEPRTCRLETAPLASGSQPHSVQAVHHDTLHPRVSKSCNLANVFQGLAVNHAAPTTTALGRHHGIYRLPRCRSALGERAFSLAGPLLGIIILISAHGRIL